MPFNYTGNNIKDLQTYLKQKNEAMQAEKKAVMEIIQPWYQIAEENSISENERKQKQKELIDLGCFIHAFNNSIQITNGLREKPDFEVKLNGKKIGVELRDIIRDDEARRKEGTFDSFFRDIANELSGMSKDLNGIYHVKFSKELTNFNLKVKAELKAVIIDAIVNNEPPAAHLIRSIRKTPHSEVYLYTSEASMIGNLKRETIEVAVYEKSERLKAYDTQCLDEVWLLMVLGGAKESANYNFMEQTIFDLPFETGFDRVFLFDFFRKEVFQLGVKTSN